MTAINKFSRNRVDQTVDTVLDLTRNVLTQCFGLDPFNNNDHVFADLKKQFRANVKSALSQRNLLAD